MVEITRCRARLLRLLDRGIHGGGDGCRSGLQFEKEAGLLTLEFGFGLFGEGERGFEVFVCFAGFGLGLLATGFFLGRSGGGGGGRSLGLGELITKLFQFIREAGRGLGRLWRWDEEGRFELGIAERAMKPDGGTLSEAQGVKGIAAAALVFVDGSVANAAKVMEHLGGIETESAFGF